MRKHSKLGSRAALSVEEGLSVRARQETLVGEVVRRMSLASLLVRGWTVLIVGALLAVASIREHARFAWLALFMALCFWLLDAYYLRQKRLFIKLRARLARGADAGWESLLDTTRVDSAADAWGAMLGAKVPRNFHGAVLGAIALSRLLVSLGDGF